MPSHTIRFAPWIGARYEAGVQGVRTLVVCESHYGASHSERPTVTPEIVKALALGERHPNATGKLKRHAHFAKIMTAVENLPRSAGSTLASRREFWNRVAYYNLIQEFIGAPRLLPSEAAWQRGIAAFQEVLHTLAPQLILCFSARAGRRIRLLAGDIPLAVVNHPSSRFAYHRVNPIIAARLETASKRPVIAFSPSETFEQWRAASLNAQPARGKYVPEAEKAELLARWRQAMLDLHAPACAETWELAEEGA